MSHRYWDFLEEVLESNDFVEVIEKRKLRRLGMGR